MPTGLLIQLEEGGRHVLIERTPFRFGRGEAADLRFDDLTFGDDHAEITRVDGTWLLADRASPDGIRLDRLRIGRPMPLVPGSEVRLSPAFGFRVIATDHAVGDGPHAVEIALACRGVTCRATLRLASVSSSVASRAAIAEAIAEAVATAGTATTTAPERWTIGCDDPVGLVHALATLTKLPPAAGCPIDAAIGELVVDGDALLLLQDDSDAARAAWRWASRLLVAPGKLKPPGLVVGMVHKATAGSAIVATSPPHDLATAHLAGDGLLLWIDGRATGVLVWITESTWISWGMAAGAVERDPEGGWRYRSRGAVARLGAASTMVWGARLVAIA